MFKLSCGHEVSNIHEVYIAVVKDYTYDYWYNTVYPTVNPVEVCRECYENYLDADLLLLTREDEENYLAGNI